MNTETDSKQILILDDLEAVYEEIRERLIELESENYDVSYIVRQKDFEINELTIAVNDLRGKLLVYFLFRLLFHFEG